MRTTVAAAAAALVLLSLRAHAADAQAPLRDDPASDTAWLRGATWEVVPIARLDSSKTKDTMAVKEIRRAFVLAPGRIVYEARLTDGNDWALFSWVNVETRRLAVQGKEFTAGDGLRKKIFLDRHWFYGARGWYAAPVAVERRVIIPNATYVTDGLEWKKIARSGDTVEVGGARVVLDDIIPRGVEADGTLLLSATFKDKTIATLRWSDGRLERVWTNTDSLPGLGPVKPWSLHETFGLWSGMRTLRHEGRRAMALARVHVGGRRYIDNVLVVDTAGVAAVVLRSDTIGTRDERRGIHFAAMSPTGAVIAQHGQGIGIVAAGGQWRELLGEAQIGHKQYRLADVMWLDDRDRAVIAVRPMETTMSGMNAREMHAANPMLFYWDGSAARKLSPDKVTILVSAEFTGPVGRVVPGYRKGLVGSVSSLPGLGEAWYFDPAASALIAVPAFRTTAGDVGVDKLIGWNSEREAVVLSGGLSLLRRP